MILISTLSRQWTAFGLAALVTVLALMWSIGSAEAGNVELADAPVSSAVSLDPGTFAHPDLEPGQPAPARFWQGPWLRLGYATPKGYLGATAACLGGTIFYEQGISDRQVLNQLVGCISFWGW